MSTLRVDNIRHNSATSDAITMASDGTCTAKLTSIGGGGLSHRNKVINGAMNICQRATTQNTISSNGYYIADRFNFNMVSVGSFRTNLFQSSQSPDGFNNSLGVSIGTGTAGAIAASERVSLEQRIEAQDLQDLSFGTSAAKSFTLSFYVRSSRTGQYGINMRQHDSGKDYNEKFDISVANTWERKIITVTGNTGDTIADDNGIGLWFRIMLRAGSSSVGNVNYQSWGSSDADKAPTGQQTTWGTDANDDFYLTGVQLEVGDTATSFEHRSISDELRRCQRYYYQFEIFPNQVVNFLSAYGSTYGKVQYSFPVTMRANPSGGLSDIGGVQEYLNGQWNNRTLSIAGTRKDFVQIFNQRSDSGFGGQYVRASSGTPICTLNAEL